MISNDAFARSMQRCFVGNIIPKSIAIALSGGVDSFCLTYLLTKYKQEHQPDMEITAITIDHSYRDESKNEAQCVGELVKSWGVNHIVETLKYDMPVRDINNFEEVARIKRYESFQKICHRIHCDALFVGHNLNDQLETFLQRLQQNSSLFGLRGLHIRGLLPLAAKGPDTYTSPIRLYRPLLSFERSDIEDTCIKHNIKWFEDHSNKNIQLTKRNLLRYLINDVIPEKLNHKENIELSCVSKKELLASHNEVVILTDFYQEQINLMRSKLTYDGNIITNIQNGSIILKIPHITFKQCDQIVFSRFLYLLLSRISSVKHYHWSYAKLERQAVPRIYEFYSKNRRNEHLKLTYLNVLFDITINDTYIHFNFSRQPITRTDMKGIITSLVVSNNWTKWTLFDRRYWLRLRSKTSSNMTINIVPYDHATYQHEIMAIMNLPKDRRDVTYPFVSSPVIVHNDIVLALPTYDIYRNNDLEIEWSLKEGF